MPLQDKEIYKKHGLTLQATNEFISSINELSCVGNLLPCINLRKPFTRVNHTLNFINAYMAALPSELELYIFELSQDTECFSDLLEKVQHAANYDNSLSFKNKYFLKQINAFQIKRAMDSYNDFLEPNTELPDEFF